MITGIGTPISQSRIPSPMRGLLFFAITQWQELAMVPRKTATCPGF
jgi:hypothetical protein